MADRLAKRRFNDANRQQRCRQRKRLREEEGEAGEEEEWEYEDDNASEVEEFDDAECELPLPQGEYSDIGVEDTVDNADFVDCEEGEEEGEEGEEEEEEVEEYEDEEQGQEAIPEGEEELPPEGVNVGQIEELDNGMKLMNLDEDDDEDERRVNYDTDVEEALDEQQAEEQAAGGGGEKGILEALRDFYHQYRYQGTQRLFNALLKMLAPFFLHIPSFPKDSRQLSHVKRKGRGHNVTEIEQIGPEEEKSQYAHIGLKKGLLFALRGLGARDIADGIVRFWFYFDGVSVYANSEHAGEFWPLLARIMNVPYLDREVIYVGLYYGAKKPRVEDVMSHFNEEYEVLHREGLELSNGERVGVEMNLVIADSPGRCILKGIIAHNGTCACERCEVLGKTISKRMCFDYALKHGDQKLRTDESFRNKTQRFHHKDDCCFAQHLDLDLVRLFVLDPMHLVYLGAGNRWLKFLFRDSVITCIGVKTARFTALAAAYARLRDYCPTEFGRPPRSLTYWSLFKATELRQFFLYAALSLFVGHPDVMYKPILENLLLFCSAMRILSDPLWCKNDVMLDLADKLIVKFCKGSAVLFGRYFVVYCAHSLIHLVDEVRFHRRPLDELGAWWSENEYRLLVINCAKSSRNTLRQGINRVETHQAQQEKLYPGGQQEAAKREPEYVFSKEQRQPDGRVRFLKLKTKNFIYNCSKKRDSYSEVVDYNNKLRYMQCDYFTKECGGKLFVHGRLLKINEEEFFTTTLISAKTFGIRVTSGFRDGSNGLKRKWEISMLRRKLYRLPINESDNHVLIPLLHGSVRRNEKD